MSCLPEYVFRLNMKGHSMTNPTIIAADAPKPEVNAPAVTPVTPQPDKGAPAQDKPEVKSTSSK
jgi:hypothetical protein